MKSFVIFREDGQYSIQKLQSNSKIDAAQEAFNKTAFVKKETAIFLISTPEGDLIWNDTYARYCFCKGRMSEQEFVRECSTFNEKSKKFEIAVELSYKSNNPEGIDWLDYHPEIFPCLPEENIVYGAHFNSNRITIKLTAKDTDQAIEFITKRVFNELYVSEVDCCGIRQLTEQVKVTKGAVS